MKVKEVENGWLEPGERHFMVNTEDKKTFELCYDEREDSGSLARLHRP